MLSAIGDSGQPVDWWFAYKLPRDARSPSGSPATPPSTGFEYMYFDDQSTRLERSAGVINAPGGALFDTLHQVYPLTGGADGAPGFILYNDERTDGKSDDDELGHTKGVLAFDPATNSGFWLLHSTPRFPTLTGCDFPLDEKDYAQTFLCITLKDFATVQQIAGQMIDQQEPQVYASRLPAGVPPGSPLARLTQPLSPADPAPPSTLEFTSRGGQAFRCIAKNRHWNSDYWNDLVGPALGVNLDVETWRRGTLAGTEDSDQDHSVLDTLYINLEPLGVDYEWHYTQDHAKWACSQTPDWVVVADINRDTSQEKRGGGGIAFQHPALWQSISQVDKLKQ